MDENKNLPNEQSPPPAEQQTQFQPNNPPVAAEQPSAQQSAPPAPAQPQPVFSQPAAYDSAATAHPQHPPTNAGLIVLQWLTYAFWGWTVLALSVLTATVVANFIADADTGDFTPYGIAAVLVLLPIAAVCDYFYSKQEPVKKVGAASIVMVIHAVLFALFAIGSLITAVISLVSMFTSSGGIDAAQTTLVSALIIFVFYLATFLRTLNPVNFPAIKRFFITFMIVCVGLIALLGLIGPTARARATRNDRLIESNLSSVTSEIGHYARDNQKLPSDLNQLDLDTDAQQLVDKNLVTYQPNTKQPKVITSNYSSSTSKSKDTTFYYQLCATYKEASKNKYGSYGNYGDDGYDTYVSTYNHKAGQNCYKLEVTDYNY